MLRLPLIMGLMVLGSMDSTLMAQAPPVAPRIEHQEVRHGETVVDNYYWLRQKSNPEVVRYLDAENAYTAEMTKGLQPFADSLYKEMLSHVKQTDLGSSSPARRLSLLFADRRGQTISNQLPAEGQYGSARRSHS